MMPELVALALFGSAAALASRFRVRPRPRQVLVIAGRPEAGGVGASVVHGGTWVTPALERAERLHLGPFGVRLELDDTWTQNGQRVSAVLDLRLGFPVDRPTLLAAGASALLGKTSDEIVEIARIVLHGQLVAALAAGPFPEGETDLDKIRASLFFGAAPQLDRIGLEIDRDTLRLSVSRVEV